MISFTMKTLHRTGFFVLLLLTLFVLQPFQAVTAQEGTISPTPTYDPLAEPPLPEHPTELEMGRNLYWHWCMTCHGDRGQGLTDEFRGIWDAEHQNCWGRGCHAGHSGDEGFPIPTIVPALVDEARLAQFASVQALTDFLKATHPPQSPGILKDKEYHSIALFVFAINERQLIDIPITNTSVPSPTPTLMPMPKPISHSFAVKVIVIFALLAGGGLVAARELYLRK